MDARLQRRVQRYGWDRAADRYDAAWDDALAPARAKLFEHADLRPGERVLDVACGTGAATLQAARLVGPAGSVLATDLSERMVAMCRQAAAAAGLSRVTVERADGEQQPAAAAGPFDAALCALGLMYMPDPGSALRGMAAALRPGGRVAVAVWGERRRCGWAEVFTIVDARVASEVCPLFFRLGTGEALRAEMEAAGLRRLGVDRIATTLRYATLEQACEAALDAGPVAMALSRFDEAIRQAVQAEYAASIEPYRAPDGYRIPAQFVIGSGVVG